MANVKEIHIAGTLPFDTYNHEALNKMLGQMNAPCFGYQISYTGSAGHIPREPGLGKTAMYKFVVEGEEAVSDYWFAHLVRNIRAAGGSITSFRGFDTGFDDVITLADIETVIADLEEREAQKKAART